ncbi:hypothetical protein AAVH_33614, partial [Aphelenchoides avenae]
MNSNSFPSELQYISVPGAPSTFRLETQVLGSGHAPWRSQRYVLEYLRNGEKWVMVAWHYSDGDYWVHIRAPETVEDFAYRKYQRTDDNDIQYKKDHLEDERHVASFYIGAEVTVSGETPAGGTLYAGSESPWNFASSDEMQNWDVVLSVGDSKFYAHRQTLSLMSTTFHTMFNGDFREKNQQEVPVIVEGTDAEHFEAFLQCLYPYGREPKSEFLVPLVTLAQYFNVKPAMVKRIEMLARLPCVSKLDKFRVALEIHSSALE